MTFDHTNMDPSSWSSPDSPLQFFTCHRPASTDNTMVKNSPIQPLHFDAFKKVDVPKVAEKKGKSQPKRPSELSRILSESGTSGNSSPANSISSGRVSPPDQVWYAARTQQKCSQKHPIMTSALNPDRASPIGQDIVILPAAEPPQDEGSEMLADYVHEKIEKPLDTTKPHSTNHSSGRQKRDQIRARSAPSHTTTHLSNLANMTSHLVLDTRPTLPFGFASVTPKPLPIEREATQDTEGVFQFDASFVSELTVGSFFPTSAQSHQAPLSPTTCHHACAGKATRNPNPMMGRAAKNVEKDGEDVMITSDEDWSPVRGRMEDGRSSFSPIEWTIDRTTIAYDAAQAKVDTGMNEYESDALITVPRVLPPREPGISMPETPPLSGRTEKTTPCHGSPYQGSPYSSTSSCTGNNDPVDVAQKASFHTTNHAEVGRRSPLLIKMIEGQGGIDSLSSSQSSDSSDDDEAFYHKSPTRTFIKSRYLREKLDSAYGTPELGKSLQCGLMSRPSPLMRRMSMPVRIPQATESTGPVKSSQQHTQKHRRRPFSSPGRRLGDSSDSNSQYSSSELGGGGGVRKDPACGSQWEAEVGAEHRESDWRIVEDIADAHEDEADGFFGNME